jgi:hypothetical protein
LAAAVDRRGGGGVVRRPGSAGWWRVFAADCPAAHDELVVVDSTPVEWGIREGVVT